MTNQEKKVLSKAVGKKLKIPAFVLIRNHEPFWLHEDWARLMPLAVEQGVGFKELIRPVSKIPYSTEAFYWGAKREFIEQYKDHPTKEEAVRIAICRALLEKE